MEDDKTRYTEGYGVSAVEANYRRHCMWRMLFDGYESYEPAEDLFESLMSGFSEPLEPLRGTPNQAANAILHTWVDGAWVPGVASSEAHACHGYVVPNAGSRPDPGWAMKFVESRVAAARASNVQPTGNPDPDAEWRKNLMKSCLPGTKYLTEEDDS